MVTSPFSPPGAQQEHPSKRWSRSKAIAGRSRTVLKLPKTSLGSITTRSRSWHGWHRHVSYGDARLAMMAVIRHHANSAAAKKKRNANQRQKQKPSSLVIDPMVNPGSSAHRHQARPKADPTPPTSSHGHSGAELTRRSPSARTSKQNDNCNARACLQLGDSQINY